MIQVIKIIVTLVVAIVFGVVVVLHETGTIALVNPGPWQFGLVASLIVLYCQVDDD